MEQTRDILTAMVVTLAFTLGVAACAGTTPNRSTGATGSAVTRGPAMAPAATKDLISSSIEWG